MAEESDNKNAVQTDQVKKWAPVAVLGLSLIAAFLCLLFVSIASLVEDRPDETLTTLLQIAMSLTYLYVLFLSLAGAYYVVSQLDFERLFPSPGWLLKLIVIVMLASLIYSPLAFIIGRIFAFGHIGWNLGYSLEQICEGILVLLVFGGIAVVLLRQKK